MMCDEKRSDSLRTTESEPVDAENDVVSFGDRRQQCSCSFFSSIDP